MVQRLRNFDDAYLYLRERHRTTEATAPYCAGCAMLAPCPVEVLLNDHDRLARNLGTATRYIEERAARDPAFAKALEIERLEARHMGAGDRRDGAECDRIEAELFRLTGDPRWAPDVPDEEE